MNVKRIVVDELPANCARCQFSNTLIRFYCTVSYIELKNKYYDTRPKSCPLEVEEVCEWKFWWTEEYSGDPEDTPDSFLNLITGCEWDYPELTGVALYESGDVAEFMMRVGYDCCPKCGRKIVYKESE